jgi:hypothetical protein
LIMSEANNGQDALTPAQAKPKRHNAKLCPFAIRQRIVNALANGDSIRAIARTLHVSNNTVAAIREQDWQQVETRKERLAAQAERNALMAGEQIAEALEQRKYPPSALVPVYGVSLDKALALRADSQLRIGVDHRHEHIHAHITPMAWSDVLAGLPSEKDQQGSPEPLPEPEPPAESAAPE